ncbi:Zinc finger C-x8-C-x5-C-x3-H type family protein [Perilla frutescens var. hirtella]|uniref:Zinc finger C-x8-C-x5-C-x3-H type family protein n=1 Tax=Perilla frutescens var. hirtella TaxID=608512 RepID=A0AAD4IWN9_PERFH|nr:Zinc finger C-x8-C-x5-C-x3-H type family protein [Perilla frutescens var. hirtella]
MAESPSSTSENPQIEKAGLGFLVDDDAPSDPIEPAPEIVEIQHSETSENAPGEESDQPTAVMVEVVGETAAADDEEIEFRNAIERDLREFTIQQAQIEWAFEKLETNDEQKVIDLVTVGKGDQDEEKDEKGSESFEDEIDIDGGDEDKEGNVASKLDDGLAKLGRFNQNNSRKRTIYPMRPDAEDCAYYMKFGSCKFGLNCKFNHPPRRKIQGAKERTNHKEENSERGGQTECKYYLTSGGCKYGKDCKYSHGSERSSTTHMPEFNFLGLPIRIGEKECPYYMRTGSCKYGSNCRFHHPEPVTVGGDSPSGYRNGGSFPSQFVSSSSAPSWSSPRAFNETSPFVPVMFPPSQGAPTSNQDWNGYQAPTYASSEGLPTPPAFAMNNLPADINFHMRHQPDIALEEYPERPGEQECSFFLKTGDCKFKSNCKFHHPKIRMPKGKVNSHTLSDKGLPLRPDQPICTHYHRYGICKYGPACKYDHPSNFAILPTPFDQPPFGNSNTMDGGVMLGKGNES